MGEEKEPVYIVNLPGYSVTEAIQMKFQKYKDLPLHIRRRGLCWPWRKRTSCLQIMLFQALVTLFIISIEYMYISGGSEAVHEQVRSDEEPIGRLQESIQSIQQLNDNNNYERDDSVHSDQQRYDTALDVPMRLKSSLTLGELAQQGIEMKPFNTNNRIPIPDQFDNPLRKQIAEELQPALRRQPVLNLNDQYKQLAESALNKELSNLQQRMEEASQRLKEIMDSQHN